jgi:hypothetical protein
MSIIVFFVACIALLWGLLLLAVSTFFRGMAIAAIGATFLNIAHNNHNPLWLVVIGTAFILFPVATMFRRQIFGE